MKKKKKKLLFKLIENQAEVIEGVLNEINALNSIIGKLETKAQACEQIQATLQAQCNELRHKNERLRERLEFLDIENQTLGMIVEKRFNKIAEAATSKLNLVTKNLEPR